MEKYAKRLRNFSRKVMIDTEKYTTTNNKEINFFSYGHKISLTIIVKIKHSLLLN